MGRGILDQVEFIEDHKDLVNNLDKEILDNFINELIELNKMSKNKNKNVATEKQPTEELRKSVFALYKPNKIEDFVIKNFTSNRTSDKLANGVSYTLGLLTSLSLLSTFIGLDETAISLAVMFGIVGLPVLGGVIYHRVLNKKRIDEISNILKISKDEVRELEKTYYK